MVKTRFKITLDKDLYNSVIPDVEYLISRYVCDASLIYYAGPPGSFKTGILSYVAICGAYKKKMLNGTVKKNFRTLFIDEENGKTRTKLKLKRLVDGLGLEKKLNNKIAFANISGFRIEKGWVDDLEKLIDKGKFDLVVIDNIARCLVGSERDEKDVSKIHALLKPLIEKHGVTIVIIHHLRKGDYKVKAPKTLSDISGSRDFGGQCDEAFLLDEYKRKGNDTKIFKLIQLKRKDGLEYPAINFSVTGVMDEFNITPLTVKYMSTISEAMNKMALKISVVIRKYVKDNPKAEYTTKELRGAMECLNYKKNSINNALQLLCDECFLTQPERGKYAVVV